MNHKPTRLTTLLQTTLINQTWQIWRRYRLTLALCALVLVYLSGCSRAVLVTSYYLLDYQAVANNPKLLVKNPIPGKVQVTKFKIPRSFDSIRIIARYSSHQINYYRYSLWAVRPQIAVADLISQHINVYKLFQKCQLEFIDSRPDYEISGEIFQVEKYQSEKYSAAHLKMMLELHDYNDGSLLVRHEFDREVAIPPDNMTIFAKALSDILNQEVEIFLVKVEEHFNPAANDSLQGTK